MTPRMPLLPISFLKRPLRQFSPAVSLAERIAQINRYLSPDARIESDNHTIIVWLTRADKRNALSFELMDKLIWLADILYQWSDIRAVIIAGEGKSFCTGIDLNDLNRAKNLKKIAWELIKPTQSKFQQVCLRWRELPMPVISVIQGHCLGAGLQLALATDIRFSSTDCKFAIMEAKWGLVPDMGLTQSGFGVIRADIIKELAMTARLFDAKQALDYGIISYLSDTPLQDAKQLVTELTNRSPDAVLASKRIVNAMYQQSAFTLYQEKLWQVKMLISHNRKLAIKKAKDESIEFVKRQFH